MNRALAILGIAVVLTLGMGHLLRDSPGFMVHNPDGTTTGDITHYVYWTRLVTLDGVQSAYGGRWPETYAVYPPLNLYAYAIVGSIYRLTQDPTFDPVRAQESLVLREGIKSVALGMHVLSGLAIFWVVRRLTRRPVLASGATAAYLLNPAVLYDIAHWGQPDATHGLFAILATGGLELGLGALAWAALALAVLAKPQACAIIPALGVATWRSSGVSGTARDLLVAGATGVIGIAPFLISGRLPDLLTLPSTVSSVMPVVSADAHNLWWLVASLRGLDPLFVQETARVLGPLTYRTVASAIVLAVVALVCWLVWSRRVAVTEGAALSVLGWFAFTTQAHENHVFFVLPLLSLAWPTRRGLLVAYVMLSLTLFLNMFLHDQLVLESLGWDLHDPRLDAPRLANAALTVMTCLVWLSVAVRRAPMPRRASDTVEASWPTRPFPEKAPI